MMIALPDDAGSLVKNTAEMKWPLGRDVANVMGKEEGHPLFDMGKMFSLRMRANYQNLSLNNLPAGQTTEFSGIEAFFDTATNDALGNGNQLAPFVFAVFP